ncbi:DUF3892 domain-containing protein [Vallitalea okinawensis]|uniref:DUF3892 domain-containing protein n=1 Tax=Vallitalea okinawensis TaxID=2078660 RepID=UPI001FA8B441|nr:DUF3892 domain-containing protein [Vallitalea okinawensis]
MRITHVKRDGQGTIQEVMFDDGKVLDKTSAIQLAENGLIDGVEVRPSKSGSRYLRSIPDETTDNNLDNLPQF